MRSLLAIFVAGIGVLAGWLSAWADSPSMQIGMAALGLLVAMPISAPILAIRRLPTASGLPSTQESAGDPSAPNVIAENFARDHGYPPHMKPPDALPDKHQFDPDKLD